VGETEFDYHFPLCLHPLGKAKTYYLYAARQYFIKLSHSHVQSSISLNLHTFDPIKITVMCKMSKPCPTPKIMAGYMSAMIPVIPLSYAYFNIYGNVFLQIYRIAHLQSLKLHVTFTSC